MDRFSVLRRRAEITSAIRSFFDTREYLAVETPHLTRTPIPEAHITLFSTEIERPYGRAGEPDRERLWLLPSPEYYLKLLLAEGSGSLYEITHSFRNGESEGPQHSPEFTMLEYYTVDADADRSLEITRELLNYVGVTAKPLVLTMAEAWRRHTGINLEDTVDAATGRGSTSVLAEAIRTTGLTTGIRTDDTWEDLYQKVFLTYVEPALPQDRPVFLTHFPTDVPTLARRLPGTPWADRWELYIDGREIANCFGEETDPERIATFFTHQQEMKRQAADGGSHDGGSHDGSGRGRSDEELEEHLPPYHRGYLSGPRLPRCSGVALGVDRLVMHLVGADTIGEVCAFHPLRPTGP